MTDRKQVEETLAQVTDKYIKDCFAAVRRALKHDAELTDEQKKQFQQFGQDGVY